MFNSLHMNSTSASKRALGMQFIILYFPKSISLLHMEYAVSLVIGNTKPPQESYLIQHVFTGAILLSQNWLFCFVTIVKIYLV